MRDLACKHGRVVVLGTACPDCSAERRATNQARAERDAGSILDDLDRARAELERIGADPLTRLVRIEVSPSVMRELRKLPGPHPELRKYMGPGLASFRGIQVADRVDLREGEYALVINARRR
jgi:hypothetical protein